MICKVEVCFKSVVTAWFVYLSVDTSSQIHSSYFKAAPSIFMLNPFGTSGFSVYSRVFYVCEYKRHAFQWSNVNKFTLLSTIIVESSILTR